MEYRAEIEGLRELAVLPVILFHQRTSVKIFLYASPHLQLKNL